MKWPVRRRVFRIASCEGNVVTRRRRPESSLAIRQGSEVLFALGLAENAVLVEKVDAGQMTQTLSFRWPN
jgi:hypothetical protein